jgi:sensory rhodopsin
MINEELIFQFGAIIFAIATAFFLIGSRKKGFFGTEFFISFITTTSYAIMSIGIATSIAVNGESIYWSRWLFYLVACPLLVYDIAYLLGFSRDDYPKFALLTGLTMFNGFLASYLVSPFRWIFFLLSSFAFICLLYLIFQGKDNSAFKRLKSFVLVGWSLFPAVFLLAPTGFGILEASIVAMLYLLLDLITKLFFGILTSRLK